MSWNVYEKSPLEMLISRLVRMIIAILLGIGFTKLWGLSQLEDYLGFVSMFCLWSLPITWAFKNGGFIVAGAVLGAGMAIFLKLIEPLEAMANFSDVLAWGLIICVAIEFIVVIAIYILKSRH